jgi:hypothetical protein
MNTQKTLGQELRELRESNKEVYFTQLDLEAQIERIKNNQKMEPISLREVKRLITEEGYHRYQKDNTDNIGSIEEHFKITPAQVKELFTNPGIKSLRKTAPKLKVIDDLNDASTDPGDGPNARLGTPTQRSTGATSSIASGIEQLAAGTTGAQQTAGSGATEELFN